MQARLVSLFAGQELGCGIESVQRRMQNLVQVIPDLGRPQLSAWAPPPPPKADVWNNSKGKETEKGGVGAKMYN